MGARGSKTKQPKLTHKKDIKVVAVGERSVGKTCLFIRLQDDSIPRGYIPTVMDNVLHSFILGDGEQVQLSLWDTGDWGDYKQLRPLSYPNADVFIVCLSLARPSTCTLAEKEILLKDRFLKEINFHNPDTPCIFVGCKLDLRDDVIQEIQGEYSDYITEEEGLRFAERMGAVTYVECSAKTGENVQQVFEAAVVAASMKDPPLLQHKIFGNHTEFPAGFSVKKAQG